MRSGVAPITVLIALTIAGCASMHVDRPRVSGLGSTVGAGVDTIGRPAPPMVDDAWRIVFFDFEKSNLTAEAQLVIGIVVSMRSDPRVVSRRLSIVGHTDRAEHDAVTLSRRAEAVRREVLRLGVPGEIIDIEAHGDSDPMVQTEPGVREPQNRRVVLYYR